jgi:hypothetical protein
LRSPTRREPIGHHRCKRSGPFSSSLLFKLSHCLLFKPLECTRWREIQILRNQIGRGQREYRCTTQGHRARVDVSVSSVVVERGVSFLSSYFGIGFFWSVCSFICFRSESPQRTVYGDDLQHRQLQIFRDQFFWSVCSFICFRSRISFFQEQYMGKRARMGQHISCQVKTVSSSMLVIRVGSSEPIVSILTRTEA